MTAPSELEVTGMLNYLWGGMLLAGMLWGALNGTWNEVTQALLDSAKESVSLGLTMLGILSFWCGIMEIGTRAGLVGWLTGRMTPLLDFLFPELGRDHPAQGTHCGEHHCEYAGAWHGGNTCRVKRHAGDGKKDIQASEDGMRTATPRLCDVYDSEYLIFAADSGNTDCLPEPVWVKTAGSGAGACAGCYGGFYAGGSCFCKLMDWRNRRRRQHDSGEPTPGNQVKSGR